MKFEVELNKTYAEAKAGENANRCLATASEFFKITEGELKVLGKDCDKDFWIENGLLARVDYFFGYYCRGYVVAYDRPSLRFGVLYVLNEKPHKHKFVRQPAKCECGEVKG